MRAERAERAAAILRPAIIRLAFSHLSNANVVRPGVSDPVDYAE